MLSACNHIDSSLLGAVLCGGKVHSARAGKCHKAVLGGIQTKPYVWSQGDLSVRTFCRCYVDVVPLCRQVFSGHFRRHDLHCHFPYPFDGIRPLFIIFNSLDCKVLYEGDAVLEVFLLFGISASWLVVSYAFGDNRNFYSNHPPSAACGNFTCRSCTGPVLYN